MALNVKKGDTVVVIAGKDKGKTGKVLAAMPANNSVVVAGVNIVAKHQKPKSAQDKGGIIKRENKIDASNVQIVCPSCNKATRVAHSEKDGKKERICKKCGASLDVVAKKATKTETAKTTKTATKKAEPKQTKVAKEPAKVEEKKVEEKKTTKTATKPAETKSTASKSTTAKSTTTKTTATKSTTAKTAEKKTTTKSTTKKVESK